MNSKTKRMAILLTITTLCLCGCYSENHFVKKLNKQFGRGSYTMVKGEGSNGEKYTVTLGDYPDNPFTVGYGVDWAPYEYSTFKQVFSKAIYDEYSKNENTDPSLYELYYDESFYFMLQRDMTVADAEKIYGEMEKIVPIIEDKYPIFKTEDFSIGIHRYTYEEGPLSNAYILVSCKDGKMQSSSKEDFLAYQELMQEETKYKKDEGVTIQNERGSSVTVGTDTLRTLALKGFHIDEMKSYTSLMNTMVEPGEKGLSAWCDIGSMLNYNTLSLGVINDTEVMSDKNNYVYIETSNTGSEACALKDATVTKVIYHFNDVAKSTTMGAVYLYLGDECGDVTRGDEGFDLSSRWGIGKPKTDNEKQNGIQYENVLVKIDVKKLKSLGALEKLTDTPPDVKQMDITITWNPSA